MVESKISFIFCHWIFGGCFWFLIYDFCSLFLREVWKKKERAKGTDAVNTWGREFEWSKVSNGFQNIWNHPWQNGWPFGSIWGYLVSKMRGFFHSLPPSLLKVRFSFFEKEEKSDRSWIRSDLHLEEEKKIERKIEELRWGVFNFEDMNGIRVRCGDQQRAIVIERKRINSSRVTSSSKLVEKGSFWDWMNPDDSSLFCLVFEWFWFSKLWTFGWTFLSAFVSFSFSFFGFFSSFDVRFRITLQWKKKRREEKKRS